MQVLKDEIRENIRYSALLEFRKFGYEKAKMRNIADRAGVTVGNLYKYNKNKEALFDYLVGPAYYMIIELIKKWDNPTDFTEKDRREMISVLIDSIVQIYVDYRNELLIIIDGSYGSKYEEAKENILDMVIGIIKKTQFDDVPGDDFDKNALSRAISVSFMEGFIEILRNCTDKVRIKMLVRRYLEINGPIIFSTGSE